MSVMSNFYNYPVGAHIIIRDAEWRIIEVQHTTNNNFRLTCTGMSDLVRGRKGIFYTGLEDDVKILLPDETELKQDDSSGFIKSKLYIESVLRSAPRTNPGKIYVADKAAMDALPYQFDPTIQALSQTKPRILIADAVGIGKTLEAGILTSELMARGRARRILVVATKAMLLQFQQEFWNRFSIPLCRLDSVGIQRCINRIPVNKNPFDYFDKSIISVDTLKQPEFLSYLEKSQWDLIIIDEAHNVASRGDSRSQRARLANLLSKHSDSMIMLTATPHDGSAKSFASLMNILDPTAIPDPENYRADDFLDKGLVIRRFKSDIKNQVAKDFPERVIKTQKIDATPQENQIFAEIEKLFIKETTEGKKVKEHHLFSSVLTKAVFSSPAACESVLKNRIANLEKKTNADLDEISRLKEIRSLVNAISVEHFSKFNWLVDYLNGSEFGWDKNDPKDRLVIFTESIPTLEFLEKELPLRIGLGKDKKQVVTLHGQMLDSEIAEIVNDFNKESSKARLLICSDVASEGINLHHLSHRMIHFDLPWSLMTFQQRNGRIDRYGQSRQPYIMYLQTIAENKKAKDDAYILERLQQKDDQAQKNIDDPSEFLKSKEEQENDTFNLIEGNTDTVSDDTEVPDEDFNLFDFFSSSESDNTDSKSSAFAKVMTDEEYRTHIDSHYSLFKDDFEFVKTALKFKSEAEKNNSKNQLYFEVENRNLILEIDNNLRYRLPPEIIPGNGRITLTDDKKLLEKEFELARSSDEDWPAKQLLCPLHPVAQYLTDYYLSAMGRHSAPVLNLNTLHSDDAYILIQGGYPNRRGYIPVHDIFAVHWHKNDYELLRMEQFAEKVSLDSELSNTGVPVDMVKLKSLVKPSVDAVNAELIEMRTRFIESHQKELEEKLNELSCLKDKKMDVIRQSYKNNAQSGIFNARQAEIEEDFNALNNYINDTAKLENKPYIQLIAVITGNKN
ncbi:DEAD/DEAH box helicase [uncultured Ruminobacter sp.]|uniref:DEAD/DEAH box helicase n=1 Tax=uncultured Ruminobacter sp. TaxID=538947 RepID=UPI0025E1ECF6|nr:DEAD/DEAH box helicase [uncultured Ruminobacter sp.]